MIGRENSKPLLVPRWWLLNVSCFALRIKLKCVIFPFSLKIIRKIEHSKEQQYFPYDISSLCLSRRRFQISKLYILITIMATWLWHSVGQGSSMNYTMMVSYKQSPKRQKLEPMLNSVFHMFPCFPFLQKIIQYNTLYFATTHNCRLLFISVFVYL